MPLKLQEKCKWTSGGPMPLDVAAYSKLLIQRQGLIKQQGHPKAYHRQARWKQLKSGQASREQGEGWRERGIQFPALPVTQGTFTHKHSPHHSPSQHSHIVNMYCWYFPVVHFLYIPDYNVCQIPYISDPHVHRLPFISCRSYSYGNQSNLFYRGYHWIWQQVHVSVHIVCAYAFVYV